MWHMKRLIAHLTKRSRNTSIRCSIFGFDVLSLLLAKVCDVFSVIYLALLYYGHCVAGDLLLKRACTGNIWFSVGPRFLWNTKCRSFTSFELQLLPGVCLAWMYLWNNICIIGKQMLEEGPPLEKKHATPRFASYPLPRWIQGGHWAVEWCKTMYSMWPNLSYIIFETICCCMIQNCGK